MLRKHILKRGEKAVISLSGKLLRFSIIAYLLNLSHFLIILSLITSAFILFITPAAASHGQNCLDITSRKPVFQITFNEFSNLTFFELKGTKGVIQTSVPGMLSNFSKAYVATTVNLLDSTVKDYTLKLNAIDELGNKQVYSQCYHYVPSPTKITLAEPEFGYSAVKNFTTKIITDVEAICKYSINTDLSYDDPNPANTMAYFNANTIESNSSLESNHSLAHNYSSEYSLNIKEDLFPNENAIVRLFVNCNNTEGELNPRSEKFELRVDSSKPIIKDVKLSPQGTNIVSNEPLQTTLIVTSDEPARCRYSLNNISNYSMMENKFPEYDAFSQNSTAITHNIIYPQLVDKAEYNLQIACENKAKLISDTQAFTFKVDKGANDSIIINKPNSTYLSKIPVLLEVFTNRDADCFIRTPPAPGTALKTTGNNSLIHNLDSIPGISSQGKYNFTVNCEFRKSGGSKLSKEQALTLIYDIQAPEILNFSSVNTCMLNELDIKWTAKDAISTITGFLYKINANNAELFSWKETTKKEARIDVGKYDSPNITANTKYTITVAGKDSAGNIDMTGKTSQEIKLSDPFAKECLERVPPKSNITKEFRDGAAFITLTCQDLGGSGCNSESFLYGATGPSTTCSASQKYTAAVKVTNTAIFCWKVSDNAGNTHQGEQKITLNLDSDGDGIPDGIDKCPNTAKSERADQTGCAPSQKDDDDDGISNDKDICPETIQEAIDAQTINSSGCIKDSDNDGMPDYWEMKYKFDINDASDASKNPDLDGANNLQEYRQGTDPLVSDVDAGQIPDKDGDGVPDTLDKCPETASGDTVNPQTGCSKKDLDKDQDGMSNECEKKFGLDSENADDAEEDNDDDGLTNLEECEYENCELELDPNDADTDEDGYIDGKEKEEETSPCDAEDKPASLMLQYVLLVLGILFLSAGTGYLAYKRFILKESLSSSGLGKKKSKEYKLGSLDYPQSAKASLSQGSKAGAQHRQIFVKKQATAEEKRKAALQKIKDERKQGRTKELGRAFSGLEMENHPKKIKRSKRSRCHQEENKGWKPLVP